MSLKSRAALKQSLCQHTVMGSSFAERLEAPRCKSTPFRELRSIAAAHELGCRHLLTIAQGCLCCHDRRYHRLLWPCLERPDCKPAGNAFFSA